MHISKRPCVWLVILFVLHMSALHAYTAGNHDHSPRIWVNLEYLYWWVQDSPVGVPLITENGNSSAFGFVNEPGTQIVFGKGSSRDAFDFGGMNGGRLTMGGWLDSSHHYGVEISGFDLPPVKQSFRASSIGTAIPIVAIPFFSTQTGLEDVLVQQHPNTATVSDVFHSYGFALNGLYHCQNGPVIFILGFRYLNISEKLKLNDAIIEIPSLPPNSVLNVRDTFATKNHFYGGQIGLQVHMTYKKIACNAIATIALGDNIEKLIIDGQTNVNNNRILQPIGLFSEPSNSGTHKHNQFAIIPELQAKISYLLNRHIQASVAYNFFYINRVIRPGRQIDRNINLSQNSLIGGSGVLSGKAAPVAQFNNTGLWMQGISVGIDFCF
jgi:hypothetical protein